MSRPSASAAVPRATPGTFDGERLARATYLTSAEAAQYLGYTIESYAEPLKQFHKLVVRAGIPRIYTGRRLQFARVDLDAFRARLRRLQRSA